MSTSFICEHTAEYLLTRSIVDLLLPHFEWVIPVYFWNSREGASMAMQSMANKSVRIVPVYARRPKIKAPGQDHVLMKINYHIFEAAAIADRFGFPMFAGLPLITDFAGLSPDAKCAWFRIHEPSNIDFMDYELVVTIKDFGNTTSHQSENVLRITEESLSEHIRRAAKTWSWEDAIKIIYLIKRKGMGDRLFGNGYQPFFIILSGDTVDSQTLESRKYEDILYRERYY